MFENWGDGLKIIFLVIFFIFFLNFGLMIIFNELKSFFLIFVVFKIFNILLNIGSLVFIFIVVWLMKCICIILFLVVFFISGFIWMRFLLFNDIFFLIKKFVRLDVVGLKIVLVKLMVLFLINKKDGNFNDLLFARLFLIFLIEVLEWFIFWIRFLLFVLVKRKVFLLILWIYK